MCAILDANTFSRFKDPTDNDMKPVWKWLEDKNGKIAYAITEKFEAEWEKGGMNHMRDQLMRSGQLKFVSEGVENLTNELIDRIKSDDPHIIALALIAGIKVLISYRQGDSDLFADFKSSDLVNGKVYTRKTHAHLLTKDTCP
ncbi:hypothetical protein F4083_01205 [Candidatus Poribacteria bacterium]|nr:hypothetical protein [Candidatus Poribacteria bacterium]